MSDIVFTRGVWHCFGDRPEICGRGSHFQNQHVTFSFLFFGVVAIPLHQSKGCLLVFCAGFFLGSFRFFKAMLGFLLFCIGFNRKS